MQKTTLVAIVNSVLPGLCFFASSVQAAQRLCDDATHPTCSDTGDETPSKNLSYPVIRSDCSPFLAPLSQDDWTVAPMADPVAQLNVDPGGGFSYEDVVDQRQGRGSGKKQPEDF